MRLPARLALTTVLIAPSSALALDSTGNPPLTAREVLTNRLKLPPTADPASGGDLSPFSVKPNGAKVGKSLATILGLQVYADLHGAAGDATTDDSAALLAAGNALGGKCGVVNLTWGKRYRVGTSFRLPRCVTLRGTTPVLDDPAGHQTSNYAIAGALVLDSTATITLNSSAGIADALILQNGLSLPAPDAAGFAGTAIRCAPGTSPPGDAATRSNGPFLRDVTVIGFDRALDCQNTDRVRIGRFDFDSVNGVYSVGSFDTQYFDRMRGWPYASVGFRGWTVTGAGGNGSTATVTFAPASTMRVGTPVTITGLGAYDGTFPVAAASPGSVSFASRATGAASGGTLTNASHTLTRAGTAFDFDGQQDDTHVTNALALGYRVGFDFRANGNIMGDMLWSDAVPVPITGSVGFRFRGPIGRTSFGQLYANGSTYAVQFSAQTGAPLAAGVDIAELFVATTAPGGECVNVATTAPPFLNIQNINLVGCPSWAIDLANAPNVRFRLGGGTMIGAQGGRTTAPYIALPASGALSSNITINGKALHTDQAPGASLLGNGPLKDPAIASATNIQPPASGADAFALTGTATVRGIGSGYGGREILFTCADACSFANGGNLALNAGAAFAGSAGAMIRFRFDANQGFVWREMWRSKP